MNDALSNTKLPVWAQTEILSFVSKAPRVAFGQMYDHNVECGCPLFETRIADNEGHTIREGIEEADAHAFIRIFDREVTESLGLPDGGWGSFEVE